MRSILKGAGLGSELWSDALMHAVYVKNRLPHLLLLNQISPFQSWMKNKHNLSHLRAFGSLVFIRTPGVTDRKLDTSRVHQGIFLGFSTTKRNIKYLDNTTNQTKISRHFVIDEANFLSPIVIPPYANDLLKYKKGSTNYNPGPAKAIIDIPQQKSTTSTAATIFSNIEVLESDLIITPSPVVYPMVLC